jgi:hypothetical protein
MGKVKQFACWLSECVYRREMTNEEIIRVVKSQFGEDEKDVIDILLLEQLATVRNLPSIYALMVDRDT